MTPIEFANKCDLKIVHEGNGNQRVIKGVYCCDLLSVVMGKAKEDDAWITVMGNINSVAVSLLADTSCIILSEGMSLDDEALSKAKSQNICILQSDLPTYEISILLYKQLNSL